MFACCRKGRFFGAALFLLLLVGVGGWWLACPKPVAEVGEARISEQDIAYRIGVDQGYGTTIERPAALVALVKDTLARQVAARAGVMVSEKELDAFSAGVDKHSKAPAVLRKVKQVFGNDTAAYRRLYLGPKVLNRKLRNWFSRDAGMQKGSRSRIQKAYALAAAGNDFARVAKATGLQFAAQDYRNEKQDAPAALKAYFPEGMAMLSPGFKKLLDGLKAGEMANTIAEDDASYRVVRLVEKSAEAYRTEEIVAPKASFDAWFKAQVKSVPVHISDVKLRQAMAAKYPKLDWLR